MEDKRKRAKKGPPRGMRLGPEFLDMVDAFVAQYRLDTRTEAVERLIALGMNEAHRQEEVQRKHCGGYLGAMILPTPSPATPLGAGRPKQSTKK